MKVSRHRRKLKEVPGLLLDDFTATTGWTPTNAVLSASSVWSSDRGGSMLVTGSAAGNVNIEKTVSIDLASFQTLTFDVNIVPFSIVSNIISVSIGNAGLTSYFQASAYSQGLHSGENLSVTLRKEDFVATGGATWTGTAVKIYIRFQSVTGITTVAYIDNMRVNADLDSVCGWALWVDDCHTDGALLWEAMKAKNAQYGIDLKLTAAVTTDFVGTSGNYSWATLDQMVEEGVELALHTKTHFRAEQTAASLAVCLGEYQSCKDILEARYGVEIRHAASPGGETTENTELALIELDIRSNRDARFGYTPRRRASALQFLHLPGAQLSGNTGSAFETFAGGQVYLDRNRRQKTIMGLVIHFVVAGVPATANEVSQTVMDSVLDYIALGVLSGEQSLTASGVYGQMRSAI